MNQNHALILWVAASPVVPPSPCLCSGRLQVCLFHLKLALQLEKWHDSGLDTWTHRAATSFHIDGLDTGQRRAADGRAEGLALQAVAVRAAVDVPAFLVSIGLPTEVAHRLLCNCVF